jgi:leucyl-tRNA synthetase
MMIFLNDATKLGVKPRDLFEKFVLVVSPFAPHLAEELWNRLGHRETLAYEPWPKYDSAKCKESTVEVVLQVNGKIRSKVEVILNTSESELEKYAFADESIKKYIFGKVVKRKIIVKNKLVNLVVPN